MIKSQKKVCILLNLNNDSNIFIINIIKQLCHNYKDSKKISNLFYITHFFVTKAKIVIICLCV